VRKKLKGAPALLSLLSLSTACALTPAGAAPAGAGPVVAPRVTARAAAAEGTSGAGTALSGEGLAARDAIVLGALRAELQRARASLRIGENAPPYFVSYLLRDLEQRDLQARFGALYADSDDHSRAGYVEVRVGSYERDNSGADEGGIFGGSSKATYISRSDLPLDDDPTALRAALWLRTDEEYKQALSDLLSSRGDAVYRPDAEAPPSFSQEAPVRHVDPAEALRFDPDAWAQTLRGASRRLLAYPEIFDHLLRFSAQRERRYLVNSEGSEVVSETRLYALHVSAVARAPDGMLLTHGRSFYAREVEGLPQGEALSAAVDQLRTELLALREAPVMDPYTGPAMLEPEATGVLFHEAIGHRLEGERQQDDEEGRTFKGQVGAAVIPAFLSVYDDPTLASWEGTPLNGSYRHDDEGVRAGRASLIEAGVLKGFLLSRSPVEGVAPKSNGHGRAASGRDPIARMGNFVVAADPKSPQIKTRAELKAALIAEAKRQKKAYALIIADISGGDTNTSSYGYQAFRGVPTLVYRVDVRTGAEELVRGVELVGTPLTVINKIVAASRETGVFNGFCGAESGYVPVSTVAPATLITEVELQRRPREVERPPVLPAPWTEGRQGE